MSLSLFFLLPDSWPDSISMTMLVFLLLKLPPTPSSPSCFELQGLEILPRWLFEWGQKEKAPYKCVTPCTHPPGKSLGSNCPVPMATRQSVTSKFFQPPGTTPSLTEDNRKPQVLKQRTEPTSNSLLEGTRVLICVLVLSTEPKGQRGAVKNTGKKVGLWNWLEERLSAEDELGEAEKILHLAPDLWIHQHVQWPAFKPLPAVFPHPTDTHRCPHSKPSRLCLSILNAFL